jgi:hypothetical protein
MPSYRYRTLAVRAAVTAILLAVITIGLLYSGLISNLLPLGVSFGS